MKIAACLLLLVSEAAVCAAPPAPSPVLIRLQDAERLAIEHDPLLPPLRAEVGVARAGREAAGLWRDPEARVTYGSSSRQDMDDDLDLATAESSSSSQWSLRVFPPNPWQTGAKMSRAAAEIRAAEARVQAAEWEAVATVRRLFLAALQAERRCNLLNGQMELAAARKQLADELKARGQATIGVAIEANVGFLDAKAKRRQAEESLRAARRALATRLGLVVEEMNLAPMAEVLPPEPLSVEALLEWSCRRPDRTALEWDRVAAEAGVREARSARIPWFSHVQGTREEEDSRNPESGWSVQAAISVPLSSLSARQVAVSAAQERLAAEKAGAAFRQNEAAIRDAHAAWREALAGYETARTDFEPVREEIEGDLGLVEGQASLHPELALKLKSDLLRIEAILLDARCACETAFRTLEEAVGVTLNAGSAAAAPARSQPRNRR